MLPTLDGLGMGRPVGNGSASALKERLALIGEMPWAERGNLILEALAKGECGAARTALRSLDPADSILAEIDVLALARQLEDPALEQLLREPPHGELRWIAEEEWP